MLLVPDDTAHLSHTSLSCGTQGIIILDIAIAPYYIYRSQDSFSLFDSTGETADGYKPGGVATTTNGLQNQKQQLTLFLSHLLDKGVIQKRRAVDPTLSSTRLFLLFPSLFASKRIPTTFSRTNSQSAGCLHKAPPLPRRRPLCPLRPSIRTLTILYGMGCRLEQDIQAMEPRGSDIWSLMMTT